LTHIYDNIHKWRRRRRLVKVFISGQILAKWFIKLLLPVIMEDVSQGAIVMEEKLISHAEYLDLVYTQSGTLYEKIPNLPCHMGEPIITYPTGS